MKHLLGALLALLLSCDSKTFTASLSEGDSVSKKVPEAMLTDETITAADSVKAPRVAKVPDFSNYTDVKEKKAAFFEFMRPFIVEENAKLEWERAHLSATYDLLQKGETLSSEDVKWLNEQAKTLRVKNFKLQDPKSRLSLKKKIDIIPEAMFLAQAANESSWGTSRFARQANNIMGQWCFTPGCGIVPSKRRAGETHEVQKFATVNAAVASYVHHINSHGGYARFRELRYAERQKGNLPSGTICVGGLQEYSARGEEYVRELRNMIRINKLEPL